MTNGPGAERRIRTYLDEGPTVLRTHVQEGIASQIRQTPQRGGRPWRNCSMSSRVLVLWPIGVLVLIVGIAIGGGLTDRSAPVQNVAPTVPPATGAPPPSPAVESGDPSAPAEPAAAPLAWIVYQTPDDQLRLVHTNGSDDHAVAADIGLRQRAATWSRDGSTVAFEADFGVASQLWSVGTDGADARPLTDVDLACTATCTFATEPTWSSDSRSLVYVRRHVEDGRVVANDLVVLDLESGTSRTLLTERDRLIRSPSWEDQSQRIVFELDSGPEVLIGARPSSAVLMIVDASAAVPAAIRVPGTPEDARDPDWGAQGLIVFVTNGVHDGKALDVTRETSLDVVDPDSGVGLRLVSYPAGGFTIEEPSWWPNAGGVLYGRMSPHASVPVVREIDTLTRLDESAGGSETIVGFDAQLQWAKDNTRP